jgi:hypothetical protein
MSKVKLDWRQYWNFVKQRFDVDNFDVFMNIFWADFLKDKEIQKLKQIEVKFVDEGFSSVTQKFTKQKFKAKIMFLDWREYWNSDEQIFEIYSLNTLKNMSWAGFLKDSQISKLNKIKVKVLNKPAEEISKENFIDEIILNWRSFWNEHEKRFDVDSYDTLEKISWILECPKISELDKIRFKFDDEFIHEIDKKEFKNYIEFRSIDKTEEENVWKKRLAFRFIKFTDDDLKLEDKSSETGRFQIETFKFIKKKIYFLKVNAQKRIFLSVDNYCTINEFIEKIVVILKYGFGVETITHLENFATSINKMYKVDEINKKFQIEFIKNQEYMTDANSFYEIHFHICFLLLLDKVLGENFVWEVEKECTRLHTLINNGNSSSTGYIDVYFEDEYGANIVEFKYKRPKRAGLERLRIEGVDQVCSYKLDGNNKQEPNLFLFIFFVENNRLKCEFLNKDSDPPLISYKSNNKLHGINFNGDPTEDEIDILK